MPDIAPFHNPFAYSIYDGRYKHPNDGDWAGTARRVGTHPFKALTARTGVPTSAVRDRVINLAASRQFMPGGRYLYATGRDLHQVNNCVLLRCPDTREGWATTSYQAEMALMTGAGIGVWYGDVRPKGSVISRTGGIASGPIPKMQQINETGRHTMQGGNRRSAIWAGLPWWHADIFEFIEIKDWSDEVKELKAKDWNFPAPMDMTNISVTLDDDFFEAHKEWASTGIAPTVNGSAEAPDGGNWHVWAHRVYNTAVQHMLKHGEPGFSIDTGKHAGEVLRNACTEITSADDSDVCNLGSLVLPRFSSPQEFGQGVRDASAFLTAGTVYSDVPYDKVAEIREKNRRLGLGLIGVHEFVMKHGARYGTPEAAEVLRPYMEEYERATEYAWDFQDRHGLSRSVGTRALAPNGTIGIVAEATPSGDPLFSAAEKRMVKDAQPDGKDIYVEHIVVDPTAKRLVDEGVDPNFIEDAYTLSYDVERRLEGQAFLQDYTDHAISSTINLPAVVTDTAEAYAFGKILMRYLPRLRGVTVYPDGARSGQPRTPVPLDWALKNEGVRYEVDEETCIGGVCGV